MEDLHHQDCRQNLVMGGVNQDQPLQNNWRLRWTAVASMFENDNRDEYYPRPYAELPIELFADLQTTYQMTVSASLQHRYNRHVLFKGGGLFTQYLFDYCFASRKNLFDQKPCDVRQDDRYSIGLSHLYAETLLDFSNWQFNVGIATQGITNHTSWSVEPRLSALWQCTPTQSLSLGVGRTQQMPSLDNIFYHDPERPDVGDGDRLQMIGSNQMCLSYRYVPYEGLSFSAEAYYEKLDHLPVGVDDPTYCSFNRFLFNQGQPLVSAGEGRNMGVTLAVDQYLRYGFYYMLNAMFFDNQWKGLDGVWRNTRQNRRWKMSATIGNEWRLGWRRRDAISLNASVTSMGGLYDTPVLFEETRKNYEQGIPYVSYDQSRALTRKYRPVTLVNTSATYRIRRGKYSHLFGFEWMNVLMSAEPWTQRYDFKNDKIVDIQTATSLPNIYYQIEF